MFSVRISIKSKKKMSAFFCQEFLATNCSTKNHFVSKERRKEVCKSEAFKPFCPLLKKSSGNPYLKICDITQYFFADAPMKKKFKILVLPPVQQGF